MLIHSHDEPLRETDWWDFVSAPQLGHLVAPGRNRELPVVVPTQYVLRGELDRPEVVLHLAKPNPIFQALKESPGVILSVAGDWAFIPASWKAVGPEEDPARGIPTTYYAAVQLAGEAAIVDDADGKAAILRLQLAAFQPDDGHVDPAEHANQLRAIRGIRISNIAVRAKFKYGGNVDVAHRQAVAERLARRDRPGDAAARNYVLKTIETDLS